MAPRSREIELTEGAVTVFVIGFAGLLALAGYLGHELANGAGVVRLADDLSGPSIGISRWKVGELPKGFVGPPPPADPQPIGEGPGASRWLEGELWWLRVNLSTQAPDVLRQQLLAEGFPAYESVSDALRVGDYATRSEAERAMLLLRARNYDVELNEHGSTGR